MKLSSRQRRELARIDRALSEDLALTRLVDLFAEPAQMPPGRRWTPPGMAAPGLVRCVAIVLAAAVAMMTAVAGAVVAGVLAPVFLAVAAAAILVVVASVVVVKTACRRRATRGQKQGVHP